MIDIENMPERLVMHNVSWSEYEQTLDEIGERHLHVAYLDGVMEIMSPLAEHEGPKKAIASLMVMLAVERQIPLRSLGSTTFRQKRKAAGSEPDECYYFNEIDSVTRMRDYDPLIHRAPDLWVEVDFKSQSVPREPIYARLGVPELWRYHKDRLFVRLLTPAGIYADSASSLAFPFLPIAEFTNFIHKYLDGDEMRVLTEFRDWVRGLPR